jgi:hypothetical protein
MEHHHDRYLKDPAEVPQKKIKQVKKRAGASLCGEREGK